MGIADTQCLFGRNMYMKVFSGKTICKGIAVGPALVMNLWEKPLVEERAEEPEKEIRRILQAEKIAEDQLEILYRKTKEELGEQEASVFRAYQALLKDESFRGAVIEKIRQERVHAEKAVTETGKQFAELFEQMHDSYMKERAADVQNVSRRLLGILNGTGGKGKTVLSPSVIISDTLTPGEFMQIDREKILGLVLNKGSEHSHTAILARVRNIPTIFEAEIPMEEICDGAMIVVDGLQNKVIFHPSEEVLQDAKKEMRERMLQESYLTRLKGKENITRSGKRVEILANIHELSDVEAAIKNDAGGIGLFRSEFLYMGRDDWPTEEEQYNCYQQVLSAMKEKKTVIRTLDLGADKQHSFEKIQERGIQFSLNNPGIFKMQLRALMRTCAANLRILYPMVSTVEEWEQIQNMVEETKEKLSADGIPCQVPAQGIMIETTIGVRNCETLAQKADFISIGTNDLTRDLLENGMSLDACEQEVHSMICIIVEAAHKYRKKVCICGEMAADMKVTEALIDMGIDEFSVAPSVILPLRQRIREIP